MNSVPGYLLIRHVLTVSSQGLCASPCLSWVTCTSSPGRAPCPLDSWRADVMAAGINSTKGLRKQGELESPCASQSGFGSVNIQNHRVNNSKNCWWSRRGKQKVNKRSRASKPVNAIQTNEWIKGLEACIAKFVARWDALSCWKKPSNHLRQHKWAFSVFQSREKNGCVWNSFPANPLKALSIANSVYVSLRAPVRTSLKERPEFCEEPLKWRDRLS